jgi:hypothetical protein
VQLEPVREEQDEGRKKGLGRIPRACGFGGNEGLLKV